MCKIFSGIITKSGVLFDLDTDSHEDIIKKHKLNDKTKSPDFVRVELTPKDGNIFNHNPENWELETDQDGDLIPSWYSEKLAEKEMRQALKQLIKERFIINNDSWEQREGQRIFVIKSKVKAIRCKVVAWGNSSVVAWGNSSVVAWGNSSVVAWGNSSVVARENSSVEAWGNSSVEAWGNSSVVAWGNSSVVAYDLASIKDIKNKKIIVANKDMKLEQFEVQK